MRKAPPLKRMSFIIFLLYDKDTEAENNRTQNNRSLKQYLHHKFRVKEINNANGIHAFNFFKEG